MNASPAESISLDGLAVLTHGTVTEITLNRPDDLNTLNPALWRSLDGLLDQLHREGQARALVISSTGKHFSAGMALDVFGEGFIDDQTPEGRVQLTSLIQSMQATFNRLEQLGLPVICAIQGGCIGGALDLVSAACLRYASADAFFCVQEINIGMVADMGTLQRLPKLMPLGIVKEMAYTGNRLNAQRALQYGLVNAVLPDAAAARDAALAYAQQIAAKPPVAIWGTKQALHYARDHSVADSLTHIGLLQAGIWSNQHVQTAVASMRKRQSPSFPALGAQRSFLEL